jgi:opacity protein-like surface antigen
MKKQLCAVALLATTALTATAQADDFTYLSGGAVFNKQGFIADGNKQFRDSSSLSAQQKKDLPLKANGLGFYLNGSYGFENNMFVEGRLQNSRQLSSYLLGVGYHYPVTQQVDVYGLVGVSKRHLEIFKLTSATAQNPIIPTEQGESVMLQDKIQPTAELGVKASLNDLAGVQIAYRFSQFGGKHGRLGGENEIFEKQGLHEGRVVGYYKVTDTLALEAGYTYNVYAKAKFNDKKLKDHTGQLGLRCVF